MTQAADVTKMSNDEVKKLAAKGILDAKIELAYRNYDGKIQPFDHDLIYNTFKEGVAKKHPRAYAGLAFCYSNSIWVQRSDREARNYLKQGYERGDLLATAYYGRYVYYGWGDAADKEEGIKILKQAVKKGSVSAAGDLILPRLPTEPVAKPGPELEKDLEALKKLAEDDKGTFPAFILGYYYSGGKYLTAKRNGKNVKVVQKLWLAKKYLTMAADRHHSGAMLRMVDIEQKKGNHANKKLIFEMLRKAVARNNNQARMDLARRLQRNLKEEKEGEHWYFLLHDAYNNGNYEAAIRIADVNYHAPGYTFRDLSWATSAKFYEAYIEACQRGEMPRGSASYHHCYHRLCELYFKGGNGLTRDLEKCLELGKKHWYCPTAQAYIGCALLHPDTPLGETREARIKGYACMLSAQRGGWKISDDTLFVMRSRFNLSRAEVAKAQSMFKEGFPRADTKFLP